MAIRLKYVLGLFLVFGALLAWSPAFAQPVGQVGPSDGLLAKQQTRLDALKKQVDGLEDRIEADDDSDARLVEIKLELDDIARALLETGLAFRPRLAEINSRLEQLGPPPAEGQPLEPDIVTGERQALTAEKAEINAVLGAAENLSVRVNNLVTKIAQLRRDLFARLLTHRYDLDYSLAGEVLRAYYTESAALRSTLASWLGFVFQFKLKALMAAIFLALCAALPLVALRRLFQRLVRADAEAEAPSYLSRLSVAFWSTLVPSVTVALILSAAYFSLDYYGVLRGDVSGMVFALFHVIVLVFFVTRLARAVLAPGLPQWRLVSVETGAARWLFWLIAAMTVVNGIDYLFSTVYDLRGSPLALTVAESLIATVIVGILVILFGFTRPFRDGEGAPRPWPRPVKYILVALGAVTTGAALLGYVGLAKFLSQQIVITGAILSTVYIGFLTAGAVGAEGALGRSAIGKRLQKWLRLDDTTLDQLGLASSIVLYVLVGLAGLPLILLQWGFRWGDIVGWIYALGAGVKLGNVSISPTGILGGVLVFIAGYLVTRWFSRWLDFSVMARGRVDTGVRNSIRTVIGYAGILIAALLGVSAAGIDLSNFALIAGGLSLGIGFGLQNVVQNFVSGLILLAERPFKVGDWVVAGQMQGTVKRISVRATEIETFQRQTLIVPNSEFINSAVGNWTHRNRLGRVEIKIGVAYGSDPRHVHGVLLETARAHPLVLKNPEPFVLFGDFGESSLDFEVRVFIADILNGVSVQNDLRFAIMEAFERENISIPFPHREVLLKTEPGVQLGAVQPRAKKVAAGDGQRPAGKPVGRGRRKRPDPDAPDADGDAGEAR